MYAASNSGQLYALDAATGNILWNFASGGTVIDGPSIVDGTLYGDRVTRNIQGTGNNKVFAFTWPREGSRWGSGDKAANRAIKVGKSEGRLNHRSRAGTKPRLRSLFRLICAVSTELTARNFAVNLAQLILQHCGAPL